MGRGLQHLTDATYARKTTWMTRIFCFWWKANEQVAHRGTSTTNQNVGSLILSTGSKNVDLKASWENVSYTRPYFCSWPINSFH